MDDYRHVEASGVAVRVDGRYGVEAMDWLAGSRLHIVDVLVTRSLTYIPLFALGFSEWALVIYAVLVSVQATMIHANIRFLFGPLCYFFVTPQFHHWHHSDESEGIDKNFAVHLPIWDFLFGSFFLPGNRWPRSYGVQGEKLPEGFVRQLAAPFRRRARFEELGTNSGSSSEPRPHSVESSE